MRVRWAGRARPRIVSLVPSATEIVAALGFEADLVGVSHCCDHPPSVRGLPVLSASKVDPGRPGAEIDLGVRGLIEAGLSVYRIDDKALLAARPDVIVTQDHCDACAVSLTDVREAVRCLGLPETVVCSLNPHDLAGVRRDFLTVAEALHVPERGRALAARFDERLASVRRRVRGRPRPHVALVEWLHPPMIAGGWMPELARIAGAEPVIVREPSAFREVDWATLAAADPDAVVVLPCGFDVERTLRESAEAGAAAGLASVPAAARGDAWIVDGDAYFNRPGPRLAESAEMLAAILHPDAFADLPDRWAAAHRRWVPMATQPPDPPSTFRTAPFGRA